MKSLLSTVLLALVLPLVLATGTLAAPFTFSQFDLGTGLTYTDSGATSTLSETSQVNLSCLDPGCAGVGTAATLTLSAGVSGPAGSVFGFDVQPLGAGTLTVTLDAPYQGETNFLTIGFSAAQIVGSDGGTDFSIANTGTTSFSSDFLNYTAVGFQLISSDANPALTIDGNGYLESFTSDSTGSFFGTPSATPVPAALPLFATGLGALGFFGWSRKRKNAATIAA
jgi:hypothetical protein